MLDTQSDTIKSLSDSEFPNGGLCEKDHLYWHATISAFTAALHGRYNFTGLLGLSEYFWIQTRIADGPICQDFVRSTKNFSNPIWYSRQPRIDYRALPASLGLESNAILEKFLGTISKMALKSAGTSVLDSRLPQISAWIPLKFLVSTKI